MIRCRRRRNLLKMVGPRSSEWTPPLPFLGCAGGSTRLPGQEPHLPGKDPTNNNASPRSPPKDCPCTLGAYRAYRDCPYEPSGGALTGTVPAMNTRNGRSIHLLPIHPLNMRKPSPGQLCPEVSAKSGKVPRDREGGTSHPPGGEATSRNCCFLCALRSSIFR
jgi:hypothetical protein